MRRTACSCEQRAAASFTIGARAASKVLVQATRVLAMLLALVTPVLGQSTAQMAPQSGSVAPQVASSDEPFRITDNSFLVEEAFNQEAGVFQNIFGPTRANGRWGASVHPGVAGCLTGTPVLVHAHLLDGDTAIGLGDTLLNYRYQAVMEGPGRPAFSPRASLVVPTGSVEGGRGAGSYGLQVNLPFSKQRGDIYWHWNAGFTWLPRVDAPDEAGVRSLHANLWSPFLAGSAIYRLRPMLHLMLENLLRFEHSFDGDHSVARSAFTRCRQDFAAAGTWETRSSIPGAALPITWGGGNTDVGLFLYLSYELPFRK